LLSVLLPINVVLLVILDMECFMLVMFAELLIAYVLGLIFSFFPSFKRGLRGIFDLDFYRKKKLGFWAYLKGYLLIVGIQVSPLLLVLLGIVVESQNVF
jgi:hypothetical protein